MSRDPSEMEVKSPIRRTNILTALRSREVGGEYIAAYGHAPFSHRAPLSRRRGMGRISIPSIANARLLLIGKARFRAKCANGRRSAEETNQVNGHRRHLPPSTMALLQENDAICFCESRNLAIDLSAKIETAYAPHWGIYRIDEPMGTT